MAFALQAPILRLAALAGATLLLVACGNAQTKNADGTVTDDTVDTKSAFKSVGADIGCGIASVLNKDCAKGARTGSRVADKVISWVFRSLKIADGKTVNKEYESKKASVSKTEIQPMAFSSKVETSDSAPASATTSEPGNDNKAPATSSTSAPGVTTSEVKITSNTDLVGYGDKVPVVTQKYALYDEKNKLVSTQTEKLAAVDGAGRYETEAKVKIPKTAKGKGSKQYRVETSLLVNGKEYKKNSYDVAQLDDGQLKLALNALQPVH